MERKAQPGEQKPLKVQKSWILNLVSWIDGSMPRTLPKFIREYGTKCSGVDDIFSKLPRENNKNLGLKAQYQNALDSSLTYRCNQLTQLLTSSSLKELKILYPNIVENVFGFRNRNDWGLISQLPTNDFDALCAFLAPNGPLLQLAYKLLNYHQAVKFDFPISCLPAPSRHLIENGDIPAFYSTKVQKYSNHALSANLQLDSFQFYFFHFAYYIVRSPENYTRDCAVHNKAVYSNLLDDYVVYFLPTEGVPVPLLQEPTPPSPPSPFRSGNWPSSPVNPSLDFSHASTYTKTPVKPRHSLLKPGIVATLNDSANTSPFDGCGSMRSSDWRSEEFIAILTEMYINQVSLEYPQTNFFMESYVPSQYHVWMVRLLVKHAHYFSNSLLTANHLLGASPLVVDPMRQLKNCILPRYIQKDMRTFMKIILERWPLDASFKVPLEMWLSYIQPWRYVHSRGVLEVDKFESKWQKFISDNISFYTPVLVKVLSRFSRMDLSCARNAFMLFRVSKVFAQEKLDTLILSVEQNFQVTQVASCSSTIGSWPYTSHASPYGRNSSSTFCRQPAEPEEFVPLFSDLVLTQVTHLLREVALAYKKVSANSSSTERSNASRFTKLLDKFSGDNSFSDEWSADGSNKLNIHLEETMKYLCNLFKLPKPELPELSSSQPLNNQQSLLSSCFYRGENQQKVPIMKNLWKLSKNPKFDALPQGHPDFQPIKTYEFHVLVKFFADVSSYINSKYSDRIAALYYQPTILGRMCQQLLAPPTVYSRIVKSKDMMSVQHKLMDLPPRVCLRYFAHKSRVLCFIMYLTLMYYFFCHPFPAILLLSLVFLLIVFVRAVFHLHRPFRILQGKRN